MNFNHLYYFHCIAKHGSITAASKFLKVSQPALSTQLKELEKNIQAPLFYRHGKKLDLTSLGMNIFGITSEMFRYASKIDSIIQEFDNPAEGQLKIGVSEDIECPFVSDLMCQFVAEYYRNRRINICLVHVRNDDLSRQLSDGEIDFAFTSSIFSCGASYYVEQHYFPVSLIFQPGSMTRFSSNAVPMTFNDWISYLVELPLDFILPSHHLKLREETERFCSKHLVRKNTVFVSSSISSIIRIASEGLGFALLPKAYAIDASNLKRIQLLGPKDGFWKSSIFIASRDQKMLGQVSHLLKSFSI